MKFLSVDPKVPHTLEQKPQAGHPPVELKASRLANAPAYDDDLIARPTLCRQSPCLSSLAC